MIICNECGHHNADGDIFCGSCGAFLEWAGERIAHAAPEPEPEPTVDDTARPGLVARVKAAVGISEEHGGHEPQPSPGAPPAPVTAPPPPNPIVAAPMPVPPRPEPPPVDRAPPPPPAPPPPAPVPAFPVPSFTPSPPPAPSAATSAPPAPPADPTSAEPARPTVKAQGIWASTGSASPTVTPEPAPAPEPVPEPEPAADAAADAARKAQLESMVGRPLVAEPAPVRPAPKAKRPGGPQPAPPTGPIIEARQPAAVKPAEPKRRRPKAPAPGPTRVLKPGDLVCGQCGEGNDPARRFCRRCGASLAEAMTVKTPWWRKLLAPFRRRKVEAGDRPGKVRRKAKVKTGRSRSVITALVLIAALALLIAFPLRKPLSNAIDSVRDRFSADERVRPVSAAASSELAGHGPDLAIDNHGNTFWAEGLDGDGSGESVTVSFDHPVDIDRIVITPGATENPGDFVQQPRPREVLVNVDSGETATFKLGDEDKAQGFTLKAKGATVVQVQILSVYGGLSGNDCAIAEIEFVGSS